MKKPHYLERETRTVLLRIWEQKSIYTDDKWECYSYSEYYNGTPVYAEIRRK